MVLDDQFIDGRKIDDSKKHLITRPAYAKIDEQKEEVHIWDEGPNYSSFLEMMVQRKEINPERMHAGLHSIQGLQFANRGLGVAKVLEYKGNRFLVATCKRGKNTLALINGYFGNGINAYLEYKEKVPDNINVADNILRTAVIEDLEEFKVVLDKRVLKARVQVTKDAIPISFDPFRNKGFKYTKEIGYEVIPTKDRLKCLLNLHRFPIMKVSSAKDSNQKLMGENIGIYFDSFHNCYQIIACVQTSIKDINFLFQTEDKYRDEKGMDTFLYRNGLKLIKLDDKGNLLPEVYEIEKEKLKSVPLDGLFVSESFIPADSKTGVVLAETLKFNEAIEAQNI